jgi:uncharacterized protein involved in oxidation of intracellular sulfur
MSQDEKIVYIVTHAGEDPDRATLPLVMANAAQVLDVQAVIVLQGTGVYLAKKGYVEHIHAPGFPAAKDLMDNFLSEGGKLLVCVPCIKERKIDESDLIEGAALTAAAAVTQELLTANSTVVY